MATATSTPHTTDRLHSYNPATGQSIGNVPVYTAADVDAAVARGPRS